jgi:hypothetical protein
MSTLAIYRIVNHRITEIGGNQNRLRFRTFSIRKIGLIPVQHEFCLDQWNPFLNPIGAMV